MRKLSAQEAAQNFTKIFVDEFLIRKMIISSNILFYNQITLIVTFNN